MFQELYVAMNVLFVCHFFRSSLNAHVVDSAQHLKVKVFSRERMETKLN